MTASTSLSSCLRNEKLWGKELNFLMFVLSSLKCCKDVGSDIKDRPTQGQLENELGIKTRSRGAGERRLRESEPLVLYKTQVLVNPRGGSLLSITQVPGDLPSSSDFCGYQVCISCTYIQAGKHSYIQNKYVFKRKEAQKPLSNVLSLLWLFRREV